MIKQEKGRGRDRDTKERDFKNTETFEVPTIVEPRARGKPRARTSIWVYQIAADQ